MKNDRSPQTIVPLVVGLFGLALLAACVSACTLVPIRDDKGDVVAVGGKLIDVDESAPSAVGQIGAFFDGAVDAATSPGLLSLLGLTGIGGSYAVRARAARREVEAERQRQEQIRRDIDQAYYEGLNSTIVRPAEGSA